MSFTKQQLQKFAHIMRIEIPEDKLESMDVDQVFSWLEQMKQIDTTGILPMFSPAMRDAPMRADVVTDGNIKDAVLANAPDQAGITRGYFAVPKVMDE